MPLGTGAEGPVVDDAAGGLGRAEGDGAGVGAALHSGDWVVQAGEVR